MLRRCRFSACYSRCQRLHSRYYNPKEAIDALWTLFFSAKSPQGISESTKKAAALRELTAVAAENPAATRIPRWYIDDKPWHEAAACMVHGAACWRYGAGEAVSRELQTSFFTTLLRDQVAVEAVTSFADDFTLQTKTVELPMMPVKRQLEVLHGLWLTRHPDYKKLDERQRRPLTHNEHILSQFPYSTPFFFSLSPDHSSWDKLEHIAAPVLVAVSWQQQKANVAFPPRDLCAIPFHYTFRHPPYNRSNNLLFLFSVEGLLSTDVDLNLTEPFSYDGIMSMLSHPISDKGPVPLLAEGGAQNITSDVKFFAHTTAIEWLRMRTPIVTKTLELSADTCSAISELVDPQQPSSVVPECDATPSSAAPSRCLVIYGESGSGKTLLGILAGAAHFAFPLYFLRENLPDSINEMNATFMAESSDAELKCERDRRCRAALLSCVRSLPPIRQSCDSVVCIVIDDVGSACHLINGLASVSLEPVRAALRVREVRVIVAGTGSETAALARCAEPARQCFYRVPPSAGGKAVQNEIRGMYPLVYRLLQQPRFSWAARLMGNGRIAAMAHAYLSEWATVTPALPNVAVADVDLRAAAVFGTWRYREANDMSRESYCGLLSMFCLALAVVAGGPTQVIPADYKHLLSHRTGMIADTACLVPADLWAAAEQSSESLQAASELLDGAPPCALLEVDPASQRPLVRRRDDSCGPDLRPAVAECAEPHPAAALPLKALYARIDGTAAAPPGYVLVARADHRYEMSAAYCELALSVGGVQARPWSGAGCEVAVADFALAACLAAQCRVSVASTPVATAHSMQSLGAACRAFSAPPGGSQRGAHRSAVLTTRELKLSSAASVRRKLPAHVRRYEKQLIAALGCSRQSMLPAVCVAMNERSCSRFADLVLWRSWDKCTMRIKVLRPKAALSVVEVLCELGTMGCASFATAAARELRQGRRNAAASRSAAQGPPAPSETYRQAAARLLRKHDAGDRLRLAVDEYASGGCCAAARGGAPRESTAFVIVIATSRREQVDALKAVVDLVGRERPAGVTVSCHVLDASDPRALAPLPNAPCAAEGCELLNGLSYVHW